VGEVVSFPEQIERWRPLAEEHGSKFGVDPRLVLAVIEQESAGDPDATSKAGASGLMQIMPATAKDMGLDSNENLFNADTNVRLGTKYLAWLSNFFLPGDRLSKPDFSPMTMLHTQLVLASYNGGVGNVTRKYRGFPPFHETMLYVLKITKRLVKEKFKDPYVHHVASGPGSKTSDP
jgi:soluble lytic murein transglycosylase-like protein